MGLVEAQETKVHLFDACPVNLKMTQHGKTGKSFGKVLRSFAGDMAGLHEPKCSMETFPFFPGMRIFQKITKNLNGRVARRYSIGSSGGHYTHYWVSTDASMSPAHLDLRPGMSYFKNDSTKVCGFLVNGIGMSQVEKQNYEAPVSSWHSSKLILVICGHLRPHTLRVRTHYTKSLNHVHPAPTNQGFGKAAMPPINLTNKQTKTHAAVLSSLCW